MQLEVVVPLKKKNAEESLLDTKFRTYIEQQLDNRSIRVLDSFRVMRRTGIRTHIKHKVIVPIKPIEKDQGLVVCDLLDPEITSITDINKEQRSVNYKYFTSDLHEYDCLTISDAKFYITENDTHFLKLKLNVKHEEVKQTSVGPDGKWIVMYFHRTVDNEYYSIENILRNDDPLYKEKIAEILDQYKKEYWETMSGLRRTV